MTTERIITKKEFEIPSFEPQKPIPESKEEQGTSSNVDLKALRHSLDVKRRFLALLDEGGYSKEIKDFKTIESEVKKAISDLDGIIRAFPDEEFKLIG
jgi:hypothetical protein